MSEPLHGLVAEIQFPHPDGAGNVHSDLPPHDRDLLHTSLDEWLDRSGGRGFFYVGHSKDLAEEFAGEES
jgi:hypothetical protein